jgi:hypothetical protein
MSITKDYGATGKRIKHNSCGGLLPKTNRYTVENFRKLLKLDNMVKKSMCIPSLFYIIRQK